MNKKLFGLLFIIAFAICSANVFASLSFGKWTANDGPIISIDNGQSSEFKYYIQAVTEEGGQYSVGLYDASGNLVKSYFDHVKSINNGAVGFITVSPSDYSKAGAYTVKIESWDSFGYDNHILTLTVNQQHFVTAAFIFTPANPMVYDTITFDASSSSDSLGHQLFYHWDFGDGKSASGVTTTHQFTEPGNYQTKLTVTDGTLTDTVTKVIPVTGTLEINQIDCFDRVIQDQNQSCQVHVMSNNHIVGGADIKLYYLDGPFSGQLFGSCKTDSLSGSCTMYSLMNRVGNYTVYATATKAEYINDTDTYPRKTFQVWAKRYDILNLRTYNDAAFTHPDSVFYRGESLYVKFQVYDPYAQKFLTNDIVTAASLISTRAGGRADLTRMNFNDDWYYYKLTPIPLTHDFIGGSNVFAFAFNFTGQLGGQAQVALTILNNKPVIQSLPSMRIADTETNALDLYNYANDLEDGHNLRWEIAQSSAIVQSSIDNSQAHPLLTVKGLSEGSGTITLNAYDLDNEFASGSMTLTVYHDYNSTFSLDCSASPLSGTAPLNVFFTATANGGSGDYRYTWAFGDGQSQADYNNYAMHAYSSVGSYDSSVTVTDGSGNTRTKNCGTVQVVNIPQPLTASCSASPTSGSSPLNVHFTSSVSGGSGNYEYTWHTDDGTIYNGVSTVDHEYLMQRNYHPTLTVKDHGELVTATCPTINVGRTGALAAHIGGPYSGFVNEAVSFDASASTGNIVNYAWDFGDGTIATSMSPLMNHIYTHIGQYRVTLTVTDSTGMSSSDTTQATVIERTTPKPIVEKHEEGLFIKTITLYGDYGEIISQDDTLTVSIEAKNEGDKDLNNARMTVEIPELGIRQKSSSADMDHGDTETFTVGIPLYSVSPGIYDVRISVGNDDVRRIKYRDFIVR
jgi:PKD repeat protein